ncbi:MAG: iron ABC transporter substrate-binding protein [Desulfamplus sp.]|nr:iron ABC transporter substrate-binding protein [Desulfamplus sp.]
MKKILIICFITLIASLNSISFLPFIGFAGFALSETLNITDMIGRNLTVPHNPEKIICLGPGTLRLIVYLDAQDKLAGVENMEKLNPRGRPYWLANLELSKLPSIGPGGPASINKKPDLEAVLSVKPDLIFMTQTEVSLADQIQKQLNIPIVVLSYGAFATFDELIYDSLRLAGRILDREERAEAVINFIESARKELGQKTVTDLQNKGIKDIDDKNTQDKKSMQEKEKPTVYVGGIGMRGSHGIESSEKSYLPLKWANAKNIVANIADSQLKDMASEGSHIFIDKEKLLSLNPDFIFIDGGGLKLIKEDIAKKPEFYNALKAFQNKKVYTLLPFNFYTTNVETALANAFSVAKILYPEQFKDIDPEKKCDEIYTFMVGKPVYEAMKKDFGKIGGLYENH